MALKLKGIDKFDAELLHAATHFVRKDLARDSKGECLEVGVGELREAVAACEQTSWVVYGYHLLPGVPDLAMGQVGITPRLLAAYDQIYGEEGKI